jgi:hypothetical protein
MTRVRLVGFVAALVLSLTGIGYAQSIRPVQEAGAGGTGADFAGGATQVAYGVDSTDLTGEAAFAYTAASNTLKVDNLVSGTDTAITIKPNGTGALTAWGGSTGVINLGSTETKGHFVASGAGGTYHLSLITENATGAALTLANGGVAYMGRVSAVSASTTAGCIAESITASSGTCDLAVFGSGMLAPAVSSPTACADNANGGTASAANLDPQSTSIQITNSDAQGCAWTMQETTGASTGNGSFAIVTLISNAGGNNVFADVAGIFAGNDCTLDSAGDNMVLMYANSQWVQVSCQSAN